MTLPGAGLEVCRYLSERIGDTTIVNSRCSAGFNAAMPPHAISAPPRRAALILPEEIRTMPAGHALIVMSRLAPIMTRLLAYYETPLKQWMDVPPHLSRAHPRIARCAGAATPHAPTTRESPTPGYAR